MLGRDPAPPAQFNCARVIQSSEKPMPFGMQSLVSSSIRAISFFSDGIKHSGTSGHDRESGIQSDSVRTLESMIHESDGGLHR